jgi:uncharacterized coiled-coil protein SlyX
VYSAALADKGRRLDAQSVNIARQQDDLKRQSKPLGTKKALVQRVAALENSKGKLSRQAAQGGDYYEYGIELEDELVTANARIADLEEQLAHRDLTLQVRHPLVSISPHIHHFCLLLCLRNTDPVA